MNGTLRPIITIDEEKCDGCGNCVPACVEGALRIVNGKARLVKQSFCDGLGACLGDCPQGALHVVQSEVEAYDEPGVLAYLDSAAPDKVAGHIAHLAAHGIASSRAGAHAFAACPSVQPRILPDERGEAGPLVRVQEIGLVAPEWERQPAPAAPEQRNELRQWPVQLHLVPPNAPYFQGAELTLIADCVPFATPDFHSRFLKNSAVAVGCPKLDDGNAYVHKLTQILLASDIRSLRVAYMEVPCCRGLLFIAQQAVAASGKQVPLDPVLVGIGV